MKYYNELSDVVNLEQESYRVHRLAESIRKKQADDERKVFTGLLHYSLFTGFHSLLTTHYSLVYERKVFTGFTLLYKDVHYDIEGLTLF